MIPIEKIYQAQAHIKPYIVETSLIEFDFLGRQLHKKILIKNELEQRTGSFKYRGASNFIINHIDYAKKHGVIAASAGNHAQGVAAISHQLGIPCTIVMPQSAAPTKIHHTRQWGARVILHGDYYDTSYEKACEIKEKEKSLFVHAFCDDDVISGQGTIGLELLSHPLFDDIEAVIISIGGGGLITGIGSAIKTLAPHIKIYAVSAENAPSMWQSYKKKKIVETSPLPTLADGIATKKPMQKMFDHINSIVDDYFLISEDDILSSIALLAHEGKLVSEGAAAITLCPLLHNKIPEKNIAVILCGGNIDVATLNHVLTKSMVTDGRLIRLRVTTEDKPGSLHKLTGLLYENQANIIQLFHQRSNPKTPFGSTEIEFELETQNKDHSELILKKIRETYSVEII